MFDQARAGDGAGTGWAGFLRPPSARAVAGRGAAGKPLAPFFCRGLRAGSEFVRADSRKRRYHAGHVPR